MNQKDAKYSVTALAQRGVDTEFYYWLRLNKADVQNSE